MGKTRAEIQKEYRERQKAKNKEEYLKKERDRRKKNYVPSGELTDKERLERNKKNREVLRRYYQREKDKRQTTVETETSGYESGEPQTSRSRDRSPSQLRIRLDFPRKRNSALKRWKKEISIANTRIKNLQTEKANMLRKYKSAQRAIQRMKVSSLKQNKSNDEIMTPRKETETLMKEANLTNEQKLKIRKPLLFGNVLAHNIKSSKENANSEKVKSIHRVVSGKIIRKYRCATMLSRKIGLCRHRITRVCTQDEKPSRLSKLKRHQDKIVQFFEREDNSRVQPGKCDVKKVGKGKGNSKQVHVLTDYLNNLYVKFRSENPGLAISFTSFTRARPKHVLLTSFISRHTCLCTKHQNAALTVKTLRAAGMIIPSNPEKVIDNKPSSESIRDHIEESVNLGQWQRKEIEEKGKKKYVTKIVQKTLTKEEMVDHFENQMQDFEQHVKRVTTQYNEIRHLKENLPPNHMIVQMDFSENYSCKSLDEVQSAYFNQTNVTLHPVVAYHHGPDGNLKHTSYIIVSDEMGHKSSTVLAFVDAIMPDLKSLDTLDTIHYWTDSPSSQYRNKSIFDYVANHEEIHGVKAIWNYFETGHGKGPCDGLGGTCKRLADQAVRSGKVLIQDAEGFYDWATSSSMTNVTFKYVSSSKCGEFEESAKEKPLQPIKGTMKVHAVVGLGQSQVKVRDTSCYCEECLSGNLCDTWRTEKTRRTPTVPVSVSTSAGATDPSPETSVESLGTQEAPLEIGQYVAAKYDMSWYIGKIVDIDTEESDVEITFMEKRKQLFNWPRYPDKIWVKTNDILCALDSPVATGKSNRMYKISSKDEQRIVDSFEKHIA